MGFAKWYVREALKHCQPGDVAAAFAILSGWAAQTPAVRDQSESAALAAEAQGAAAAEAPASGSQVMASALLCNHAIFTEVQL